MVPRRRTSLSRSPIAAVASSLVIIAGLLTPTMPAAGMVMVEPDPTSASTPAEPPVQEPIATEPSPAATDPALDAPVAPEATDPDPASQPAVPTEPTAPAQAEVGPMAVIPPYTISRDGITYTITRISDGTGQGSPTTACPINTARGFTPGDDTTTDGYACAKDSATYRVTINVTAQATNRTPSLSLTSTAPLTLDTATGNFCAGTYVGALHTGRLTSNSSSNVTCAMTFGANVSGEESFTFSVKSGDSGVLAPSLTVTSATGTDTLRSQDVTYLAQPTLDVVVQPVSQGAVLRNGQSGQLFTIPVDTRNIIFPEAVPDHKGMPAYANYTEHSVVVMDVSSYPAGTLFFVNGAPVTAVGGQITIDYTGSTHRDPGTSVRIGTLEAFIPADVVATLPSVNTYTPHVVSSDISLTHKTTGLVLDNFAGMTSGALLQPGETQPSTYDTLRVDGRLALTGTAGAKNNDWASVLFYPGPGGAGVTKSLLYENGTAIGGNWLRAETKYWSKLVMSSAIYTSDEIVMCDRWYNQPSSTFNTAPQHYDATRTPTVKIQNSTGAWVDQPYQIWYADLASNPDQGCGTIGDLTGWSQDITTINGGNPDAVRIVMTNVDMGQAATTELLDIRLPMQLGPETDYGLLPSIMAIYDWGWFTADPAATTWKMSNRAQVIVTAPQPVVNAVPTWTSPGVQAALGQVSAGSSLDMRYLEIFRVKDALATDVRSGTVTSTVTLDSCVVLDETRPTLLG